MRDIFQQGGKRREKGEPRMKVPGGGYVSVPLKPWILKSYEKFNRIAAALLRISQAWETFK